MTVRHTQSLPLLQPLLPPLYLSLSLLTLTPTLPYLNHHVLSCPQVKRMRKERDELMKLAHRSAELVTATIRMKIALKVSVANQATTTTVATSAASIISATATLSHTFTPP